MLAKQVIWLVLGAVVVGRTAAAARGGEGRGVVEFNFPSWETDPSVRCSSYEVKVNGKRRLKLAIDGHRTGLDWSRAIAGAHKIPSGGHVVDLGGGRFCFWHAERRTATAFSAHAAQKIPKLGVVFLRFALDGARIVGTRLCDVHPDGTRLRTVWEHVPGANCGVIVCGQSDGRLVLLVYHQPKCPKGQGTQLLVLASGKPPAERPVSLGRYGVLGPDAVRGSRVLVVAMPRNAVYDLRLTTPYKASVGILDIRTGKLRSIGAVPIGWTTWTAIPHPRVHVQWISAAEARQLKAATAYPKAGLPPLALRRTAALFGVTTRYVIEETEEILR